MLRRFAVLLFAFVPLLISAQQKWVVKDSSYYKTQYLDSTQYLNGQKHGRSVLYENKLLYREQNWSNGQLNGWSRKYESHTGNLLEEFNYVDGELDGRCVTYSRTDKRIDNYSHGRHIDTTYVYSIKPPFLSSITTYHSSGKRKLETDYHMDGQISRLWYWSDSAGWRHDSLKSFYPNGKRKSVERFVSDDNINSSCYYILNYSRAGIIESEGMRCGAHGKEGEWKYYDSLGRLHARAPYVNGTTHGWFITYYPNGKEQLKTFCYKGFTDTITIYNSAGKIISPDDPEFEKVFKSIEGQEPIVSLRNPNWYKTNLDRRAVISAWPILYDSVPGVKPPSFPGGSDSLNSFFKRNIVYPRSDVSLGREGEIYFTFTVQPDGTITDVSSSYGDGMETLLDKEARRVFFLMPKWKPGTENGKVVPMEGRFSVTFQLRPQPK